MHPSSRILRQFDQEVLFKQVDFNRLIPSSEDVPA